MIEKYCNYRERWYTIHVLEFEESLLLLSISSFVRFEEDLDVKCEIVIL